MYKVLTGGERERENEQIGNGKRDAICIADFRIWLEIAHPSTDLFGLTMLPPWHTNNSLPAMDENQGSLFVRATL